MAAAQRAPVGEAQKHSLKKPNGAGAVSAAALFPTTYLIGFSQ